MDIDDETVRDIRASLARLITDGLVPYNVGENGGALLDLAIVQSRLHVPSDATEAEHFEAFADALTSVLAEAMYDEAISGKHRRLLRSILPLEPELLGTSVKERRVAAAKNLKPGGKAIGAGTIRTYYEPKALDKLAQVLVEMELSFRAQAHARARKYPRTAGG